MPKTTGPSPSAVRAAREVRTTVSRLRRRILGASRADDMTLSQASLLGRLAGSPGATASELAAAEGVRHQSVTAAVAVLAELGLVERTPDPGDGRRLRISLTKEGHRRVEQGRQLRGEWLTSRLQERCTEPERQLVLEAMAVLQRLIDD